MAHPNRGGGGVSTKAVCPPTRGSSDASTEVYMIALKTACSVRVTVTVTVWVRVRSIPSRKSLP